MKAMCFVKNVQKMLHDARLKPKHHKSVIWKIQIFGHELFCGFEFSDPRIFCGLRVFQFHKHFVVYEFSMSHDFLLLRIFCENLKLEIFYEYKKKPNFICLVITGYWSKNAYPKFQQRWQSIQKWFSRFTWNGWFPH